MNILCFHKMSPILFLRFRSISNRFSISIIFITNKRGYTKYANFLLFRLAILHAPTTKTESVCRSREGDNANTTSALYYHHHNSKYETGMPAQCHLLLPVAKKIRKTEITQDIDICLIQRHIRSFAFKRNM